MNKYSNTYHRAIKIKLVDVRPSIYIDFNKENNNLLQKTVVQLGLKKFLWFKKLKILCHGHMLLVILREKKLLERFTKKNYEKKNLKEFRVEKVIKRKSNKLYVKWKD